MCALARGLYADNRRRDNPLLAEYFAQRDKYAAKSAMKEKDLSVRQSKTLQMLESFKAKLEKMKEEMPESVAVTDGDSEIQDSDPEEDIPGEDWLLHKFVAKEEALVPAKNVHVYNEDTYDINDPRNPINKRRREPDTKKGRRRKESSSLKRPKV
ncbi:unnamed protein product [Soboliphyme baturini]|uniref:RRP15-like protein n=1 Tax=Soboliphyme baturini TaxID=241478 RepID=A0A183IYI4_9BILA|nr:unnamed protein product [Soboliphyme baturini]